MEWSIPVSPQDPKCEPGGHDEIVLVQQEEVFSDSVRAETLLKGFSKLYHNKMFTDVVLCAGHKEFPCHRNILAVSSPYFMAMFSNDMAEKNQEKINIRDIDVLTTQLVLDYIYTGQVLLSKDTVQNLLSAANIFQLLALRNGCANFMMKHVNPSNCIGVYFFAKAHQCSTLAIQAKIMINHQFSQLYSQAEFLSLPTDKVVEIISDDDLAIHQEEIVYEACMEWLKKDHGNRMRFSDQIMSCVRFANISSYYFCDKIDSNPVMHSNETLKRSLDKIRYFHMLRNRHLELGLDLMPRTGMNFKRGVIIIANPYAEDIHRKYSAMEILFPKTGDVHFICKLPQGLSTPGCAVTGDNQIFVVGGMLWKVNYQGSLSMEGIANNVIMYDQTSATWQTKAKMTYARSQFALTIVDSYMYAIGGYDGMDIMKSMDQYNFHANSWSCVEDLPQPLRCLTAVSYKGKLYVFGGEGMNGISSKAYRYDPNEDAWTELPSMSTHRAMAGSTVYKGKIYIIGGNSAVSEKWRREFLPEHCVNSVEIFDPESETWSFGPELPNDLCGAGVVNYADSVLIIGGEDDKSWMTGLCWLKEEDGRQVWVEGAELPTVMSTFGCLVANIPQQMICK